MLLWFVKAFQELPPIWVDQKIRMLKTMIDIDMTEQWISLYLKNSKIKNNTIYVVRSNDLHPREETILSFIDTNWKHNLTTYNTLNHSCINSMYQPIHLTELLYTLDWIWVNKCFLKLVLWRQIEISVLYLVFYVSVNSSIYIYSLSYTAFLDCKSCYE